MLRRYATSLCDANVMDVGSALGGNYSVSEDGLLKARFTYSARCVSCRLYKRLQHGATYHSITAVGMEIEMEHRQSGRESETEGLSR